MKLIITEKPSVAQSIAKVLGVSQRGDGSLDFLIEVAMVFDVSLDYLILGKQTNIQEELQNIIGRLEKLKNLV